MTTEQEWRPIPGYEGRYDISSNGEIRSWVGRWVGRSTPRVDARILGQPISKKGYRYVKLQKAASKAKTYRVHRLVLLAFAGPCPEGMEASHLNGDSSDNRIENLAWEPIKKNHARKKLHGTYKTGEMVHSAKLNLEQVRAIRSAHKQIKVIELAAMYGVSASAIRMVQSGTTWRDQLAKDAEAR